MAQKFVSVSGIGVHPLPETKNNRWTTIGPRFKAGGDVMVVAQCECGNVSAISYGSFRSGSSRSCGCYLTDWARQKFTTHGESAGCPEYNIRMTMIARCYDEGCDAYPMYGGRGIRVCQEWLDSFEAFIRDVGYRPSDAHSIDRSPNMNGNYEPGNVRWATATQQANNRRSNRLIEHGGVTKTLAEWVASDAVLPYSAVWTRLKCGWEFMDALKTPSFSRRMRLVEIDGESLQIGDWSKRSGIPASTIDRRLRLGWNGRDAVWMKIGSGKYKKEANGSQL